MAVSVYKSEKGKKIVEQAYQKILNEYKGYPLEQKMIDTIRFKTHVLKFGDEKKPPLIMIHGSTSNSATWLGCIGEFINDFSIYCVDIPGEPGLSEDVRLDLKSFEPGKWLEDLLDDLGIDKACFLTMSLGSWYGLDFAIHHPERVTGLSMITTGGIVPAKKSFIFKAIFYSLLGSYGNRKINEAVFYKTKVDEKVLEFGRIVSKYFKPLTKELPIFTDEDLKKITSPVQFFGGDHDSLIDSVATAKRLKDIFPDGDINVLEETGHVILDKFPEVKEFMLKIEINKK